VLGGKNRRQSKVQGVLPPPSCFSLPGAIVKPKAGFASLYRIRRRYAPQPLRSDPVHLLHIVH
jgi:hypothetical protein